MWEYLVGAVTGGEVSSGLESTNLGPGTWSTPWLLGSFLPTGENNYYGRNGGQETSHLGFGSEAEAEAWPLRLFRDLWNLLTAAWRRFERQVEEGGS